VSSFERTIELDQGSSRGIAVGMPVVTGGGLLGRIAQVSDSRSRVELITDPDVSVGVRLVRSGDFGATRGEGLDRPIEVDLIALDTPVLLGESVVTSGLQGSAYPEGLLVGTVTGVRPEPVADSQAVELEPAVDAGRVRFATVLLFEPEPAPPPPTTVPAATVPTTPTTAVGDGVATTTAATQAPTSASISTVAPDEVAP
jgi:rod shape-determining protein MreC